MKHASLLATAVVALIATALCTGSTSPAPSPESSQIEQLRNQIDSLRQRVDSLEKQSKDRSLVIPKDGPQDPMIIKPPYRHGPDRRNWKPFEFNGMTFYVIPVNAPKSPAPEPNE